MSPIGRTFIVLNLVLAGAFVGFAGTFLQKQHNWKEEHAKVSKEYTEQRAQWNGERERLEADLTEMTASKNSIEQGLQARTTELERERDELTRIRDQFATLTASYQSLNSIAEANRQTVAAAFEQAQQAAKEANSAQEARDQAIMAKDAAEADNRKLQNQIASLEEAGQQKQLQLADLQQNNNELNLLVDVARSKGFLDRMAVPMLAGTVSTVTGNLCTVSITDNPGNAEVKPGYRFAVYDASGYKAEARVTSVDSERNAAFCTFEIKKGDVKVGDKASTHLAGY